MGGAFDPPHLAHQALAQTALDQLQLDELRLIPTGQAWHKPRSLSAPEHRLAMLQLAFGDQPKLTVDHCELERNGPSYTIDTLLALQVAFPAAQWFLIIGADQANALTTWRRWQEILRSATICVAYRVDPTRATGQFDAENASQVKFVHLKMPAMDISATDIRARITTHRNVSDLVCEPVARYIADHHLYQTD
jgi:nicotinate-nucleotide adenylyltransferase